MSPETQPTGNGGANHGWGTAQAWVVGFGAGLVVIALMGAAYSIGYNNGQDAAEPAAVRPAGGEKQAAEPPKAVTGPGKELFTSTCGSCHTLADAGTSGTVGPNLDTLEPEVETVETAIRIGGAGTGAMPAGLYSGKQAEQVAAYVAAVAGEG